MILPAAPPRELNAAVDAAAQRAQALAAGGRELNFMVDAGGDLRVEVRDVRGDVVKVVSPSQAMSIMSGLGQL